MLCLLPQEFWAAAANGSWLGVALSASHSTYQDSGCSLNKGVDAICGKGRGSRRQVAELTTTPMLAWFYQELEVREVVQNEGILCHKSGRTLSFHWSSCIASLRCWGCSHDYLHCVESSSPSGGKVLLRVCLLRRRKGTVHCLVSGANP